MDPEIIVPLPLYMLASLDRLVEGVKHTLSIDHADDSSDVFTLEDRIRLSNDWLRVSLWVHYVKEGMPSAVPIEPTRDSCSNEGGSPGVDSSPAVTHVHPDAEPGRDFMVLNVTDGTNADPDRMTWDEAQAFIQEFPKRFEPQGYYTTARFNRISPAEVVLMIIDKERLTARLVFQRVPRLRRIG